MTREQAEHILDAYTHMECAGGDNECRAALRDVILDAMTTSTSTTSITWPSTTTPNRPMWTNVNEVMCSEGGGA